MTELFCANPREVTEGTSAVGQVSSPNSRLPSQLLTAPTPSDINLDNEITNQVTTLLFFSFFFFFFFSSFVVPLDINLDNEITNQGMMELFCANPREVTEGTSAVDRASSLNSRLPSQVLTTPTSLDINLDNEITNHRMTELFCANPREVREGTSAVGRASFPNSRLPSHYSIRHQFGQ